MKAIIGKKIGMTQMYKDDRANPVTLIDVSDCKIAFVDKSGVELGFGNKKNPTKAQQGKYKAAGYVPLFRQYFYGLKLELNAGELVDPTLFVVDELVDVIGESKGKGYAGVVKRWGFKGGKRTHGQSDRQRAPGSIGAGTDPGRIEKGKKMAGRMGGEKIYNENKKIVDIKDGVIAIKGSVPGNKGDKVIIIKK